MLSCQPCPLPAIRLWASRLFAACGSVFTSEEKKPWELQSHSRLLWRQTKRIHVPQTSLGRWVCPTRAQRRPCLLPLGQSTAEPGPRAPSHLLYRMSPPPPPPPPHNNPQLPAARSSKQLRCSEEAAETFGQAAWATDGIQKGARGSFHWSLRLETGGRGRDQVSDRCSGDPLKMGTGEQGPLLRASNPPTHRGPTL